MSASTAVQDQRVGDWLETWSGVKFWPADPRADEVRIQDIAHSLSRQCRFGGHVRQFYSVAQHCILVSENVPKADALWGLLHDASEAYVVDLPSPVKHMLRMPTQENHFTGHSYDVLEEKVQHAIATRYGLPWPIPSSVHKADKEALFTERRDLRGPASDLWTEDREDYHPFPERIQPLDPDGAKAAYLDRFQELMLARYGFTEGEGSR